MKIQDVPFAVTHWDNETSAEHKGETGTSFWQTFEEGNLRVRMIEYSPGYKADHWCPRGHVLLVLEGELDIELKDGQKFKLMPWMSFQVADDEKNPHLAFTEEGARVFIVD
jgi:hypothetical protein